MTPQHVTRGVHYPVLQEENTEGSFSQLRNSVYHLFPSKMPRTKELPTVALQNSIPYDIALQIASSLQVIDLCSLGSCSRFWRELCGSGCVWKALYIDRWPGIILNNLIDSSSDEHDQVKVCDLKGWKELYIRKHREMAKKATSVADFVKSALTSESMEVGNYLQAVELLKASELGFRDVQTFFFKPQLHVLLNLISLHYCIIWLNVPVEVVIEALRSSNISERQVCVQWSKLGRWFYGFRLRDEFHSREISLRDLARCDEEVLGVLHRGAVHEVIRVQISAAKPNQASWSDQVARSL